MIDVMVLSVLALTAGQRAGGQRNIPMPLYRWSSMIEEGLRKEEAFRDEVQRLEEQLARAAELAKQALEQADKARDAAGSERESSKEIQARVHAMELAAEKARAEAALAKRETELARQTAAEARRQAEESEKRRMAAEQAAAEAQQQVTESIEQTAAARLAAEKARKEAALARSEGERLQLVARTAQEARKQAEQKAETVGTTVQQLQTQLAQREEKMTELQLAEATARERAAAIAQERERLVAQGEQTTEKLVELGGQVAALEVRKEVAEQTVAELEEEQKQAAEELKKSVWVRREESLRSLNISYTEYNSNKDSDFVTRRELVMPLVQMGSELVVPADFRQLGLSRTFFFGGLSDRVTDVNGTVASITKDAKPLPLESILVPGPEPQVCFVRFAGSSEGALKSISMEKLKERRLKTALLFSPGKINDNARVDISPIIGKNYLTVRRESGKKPKVGDYLLTDQGEFIGLMVTGDECYVTPQTFKGVPDSVMIPIASGQRDGLYFQKFIERLNQAREKVDEHLKAREF
jgi:hypothetical protein